LGVISYGCYLFHLTVQSAILGVPFFSEGSGIIASVIVFFVKVFGTVAVATASWFLFESPINALKNWFPMNEGRVVDSRLRVKEQCRRLTARILTK